MSECRSYFSFFYYDSVLHPYESLSKDSTFTHGQIFLREAERYNLMMYTAKLAPLDQDSIIKGLDSTAHYGDNLVRFLISKGFKVKWTHLSRHFFKKIKLDFGRDNPILFSLVYPLSVDIWAVKGVLLSSFRRNPLQLIYPRLPFLEGRDRIFTCPSKLPLACDILTVSADAHDYKSSCNY